MLVEAEVAAGVALEGLALLLEHEALHDDLWPVILVAGHALGGVGARRGGRRRGEARWSRKLLSLSLRPRACAMAANRPLQHLISTTGNPATRSSSALVTPHLAALADPLLPPHTVDPRLVHFLVAEARPSRLSAHAVVPGKLTTPALPCRQTIRALRESERAAETRAVRLHPPDDGSRTAAAPATAAAAEDAHRNQVAVRARIDQIGYRVGWATAERSVPSLAPEPGRKSKKCNPARPPPLPTTAQAHARSTPVPSLRLRPAFDIDFVRLSRPSFLRNLDSPVRPTSCTPEPGHARTGQVRVQRSVGQRV